MNRVALEKPRLEFEWKEPHQHQQQQQWKLKIMRKSNDLWSDKRLLVLIVVVAVVALSIFNFAPFLSSFSASLSHFHIFSFSFFVLLRFCILSNLGIYIGSWFVVYFVCGWRSRGNSKSIHRCCYTGSKYEIGASLINCIRCGVSWSTWI